MVRLGKTKGNFSIWNHHKFGAHTWRSLTEKSLKFANNNKANVLQFEYEDFINNPENFFDKIDKFIGKKNKYHNETY